MPAPPLPLAFDVMQIRLLSTASSVTHESTTGEPLREPLGKWPSTSSPYTNSSCHYRGANEQKPPIERLYTKWRMIDWYWHWLLLRKVHKINHLNLVHRHTPVPLLVLMTMIIMMLLLLFTHATIKCQASQLNSQHFQPNNHYQQQEQQNNGRSLLSRQLTHPREQVSTISALPAATARLLIEAPPVALQRQQRPFQGPGVDLVELNRRRFEQHHHHQSSPTENELKRGEFLEENLAAIPDHLISSLPDSGLNRQILESIGAGGGDVSSLVSSSFGSNSASLSSATDDSSEDPDGASIERLSKSCLTVHASSAKPEQLNVTFHLYTKNNPLTPYILKPQLTRLELIKSSPFDPNRPIKWITHGFHTNVDKSEWMLETKDKILAYEDANVILTDWRRGASPTLAFYPKAAANAHVVAKLIVKILRRLKNDIDFSRVHLIGHSLGAHIMGFVGSAFTEEHLHQQQQLLMLRNDPSRPFWRAGEIDKKQLIGRITACDPALPCFGPSSSAPNSPHSSSVSPILLTTTQVSPTVEQTGREWPTSEQANGDWTPSMWTHLRPDSAVIVEVMHSNPGVMGYAEPLGDYDFYPNGLERQPGCGQNTAQPDMGPVKSTTNLNHGAHQQHLRSMSTGTRTRRQLMDGLMSSIIGTSGGGGGGISSLLTAFTGQQHSGEQSRLSHTLDRFIKPIRDFFHGYTCSHHRAVEYMVESMYYERIPQDRKLDRDFVCQMVGYRCSDYLSFKRGFCFRCLNDHDCRAFTMSHVNAGGGQLTPSLASQFQPSSSSRSLDHLYDTTEKFKLPNQTTTTSMSAHENDNTTLLPTYNTLLNASRQVVKRVLPTLNHYNQNYLPQKKNQYYFDTRPTKDFCLHHYHIYVKYRWFRVREAVVVDGFKVMGTLANITQRAQITFNRYTYQAYTMLLTEPVFLGQIESLVVYGERIRPMLIEYIEITYMSNLDSRVRALGSSRLCRSQLPQRPGGLTTSAHLADSDLKHSRTTLFARCTGVMV